MDKKVISDQSTSNQSTSNQSTGYQYSKGAANDQPSTC